MDTDLNLILVDTNDMLNEIQSRYDATIMCLYRHKTRGDNGENQIDYRWSGGNVPCMGLVTHMHERIRTDMRDFKNEEIV